MKKRFLLAIIPALMALAGCSNIKQAPKTQMNENFLREDTLAHEDIFDGSELQLLNKSSVSKGPQPLRAPIDITEPVIGVQYVTGTKQHRGENKPVISFRYVAVIQSRHVKAEWIRAVSSQSGDPLKARAVKESTVAYSAINNGNEYITAESMGGSCFVVYTLYDIPLFEHNDDGIVNCNWSYIAAGLKLTDLDDPEESTISKIVAVEIGNRNHFSFYESDLVDARGYFAAGIIEGSGTAANQRVVALPGDGASNNAKKDLALVAGDRFGVFKWSSSEFKFLGSFNRRSETFLSIQSDTLSSNYVKIVENGTYTLKVNNSDYFGFEIEHLYIDLYFTPGPWDTVGDEERFEINDFSSGLHTFELVDGETDVYVYHNFDVGSEQTAGLNLVRMDASKEENKWESKWNQTGNIYYKDGHSIVDNHFTMTGWNDDSYSRSTYGYSL